MDISDLLSEPTGNNYFEKQNSGLAYLFTASTIKIEADGPKPFKCTYGGCTSEFARKSDLYRHIRIHTGDRPFKCTWEGCDKKFIQRSALKVHIRTHTGEKPHSCEVCFRKFSDSSSLARHRRIHTGAKPYLCTFPGCLKRFTRKTSLTKHSATHNHVSSDIQTTLEQKLNSTNFAISRVYDDQYYLKPENSYSTPATPMNTVIDSPYMGSSKYSPFSSSTLYSKSAPITRAHSPTPSREY